MEDKLFDALFNAKVLTEALQTGSVEAIDLASVAMDAAMEAKLQAPIVQPFVEGILGQKLDGVDGIENIFS